MERYIVISADCHAGADLADYRPYLEVRYRDEFDRWLAGYENPFRDLTAPDADRNWDSDVRQSALEADGIVVRWFSQHCSSVLPNEWPRDAHTSCS